ncbi:MAG: ABC transporter substrate-binding protein [Alphaproteobacteria bacterium]|nr:MAG: ABC transporter substrate-binding protein [Alphaproteobacteria bacterium]
MEIFRRNLLRAAAGSALTLPVLGRGSAQAMPVVKIGVLADFSGLYQDLLGLPGVECAKQAVVDFAPSNGGFGAEVVYADHQNKADVGSAIVRNWFDSEGVDMVIAGPNSAVGLAVSYIAREKNKVCMGAAVTASEFTGKDCTPNTVNWTYDAYMLSKSVAAEITKSGSKTWYFISSDNTFGASLQAETSSFVAEAGGRVLGSSKAPLSTMDFSAMLLAAQASGAEVLALAVGGNDLINVLKQAAEFGLRGKMRVAALVTFLGDIHGAALQTMQGLLFTNSFYWDLNERTRAFTARVLPKLGGTYPGMTHAGCYGITAHYLRAVAAMGATDAKRDGRATVARMKQIPIDNPPHGHEAQDVEP